MTRQPYVPMWFNTFILRRRYLNFSPSKRILLFISSQYRFVVIARTFDLSKHFLSKDDLCFYVVQNICLIIMSLINHPVIIQTL